MLPFRLSTLPLRAGEIGISPIPGRDGDFEADVEAILRWEPTVVLSMTTAPEFARAGAQDLGERLAAAGVAWSHLPVEDYGVPRGATLARWPDASARAHAAIAAGGRVLAHCYGGCGRSGMILLRLMVESGEAPEAALLRLRTARPCAVETEAQLTWAKGG